MMNKRWIAIATSLVLAMGVWGTATAECASGADLAAAKEEPVISEQETPLAPQETEEQQQAVPTEKAEEAETIPTEEPPAEATENPVGDATLPEVTEPDAAGEQSVRIWATYEEAEAYVGSKVTLHAELTGYDNVQVTYQWQMMINGEWKNVEKANNDTYSFLVSENELTTEWRLQVEAVEP